MRARWLVAGILIMATGCLNESTSQYRPPTDPVRALSKQETVEASTEAATRVDSLGRTILAHNPRAAVRPLFLTVGAREPEVFHRDSSVIVITQKLVEMCPNDADLAAILCLELGKMISEREVLAMRAGQRPPLAPLDPGLPKDVTFEPFRQAELARHERENGGPTGIPDPEQLARTYLERAGYPPDTLDKVRPQIRAAERNSRLENQMTGRIGPGSPFIPPMPN